MGAIAQTYVSGAAILALGFSRTMPAPIASYIMSTAP
jgi:hypothetical protein